MSNEPKIEIMPYVNVYQQQVIELVSTILEEFSLPVAISDQPDLKNIPRSYQKCGNFWLALYNNQVIGTVALMNIGNHQCALRKMFVHRDYRGNDKKVARSLLNALLVWCNQKGINEIYLGTRPIFLAAHRFYEKQGFIEIPKANLPNTFPHNPVDSKFYVMHIR